MSLDQFLLDHYTLDWLDLKCREALVLEPCKKSLQRLHEDIQEIAQEWEPSALELIKDFVALCCADELRYLSHTQPFWTNLPFQAGNCLHVYSRKGLLEGALELFQHKGWESGFGGAKWYTIAKAALNDTLPPRAGINTLINACHNSGSVFNRYFSATPTFRVPNYTDWGGFNTEGALATLSSKGFCSREENGILPFHPPYPLMAEVFSCLERSVTLGLIKALVCLYTPSKYVYPTPLVWASGVLDPSDYVLPWEARMEDTNDNETVEEVENDDD